VSGVDAPCDDGVRAVRGRTLLGRALLGRAVAGRELLGLEALREKGDNATAEGVRGFGALGACGARGFGVVGAESTENRLRQSRKLSRGTVLMQSEVWSSRSSSSPAASGSSGDIGCGAILSLAGGRGDSGRG